MPVTLAPCSASFTASSLWGFTMAVTRCSTSSSLGGRRLALGGGGAADALGGQRGHDVDPVAGRAVLQDVETLDLLLGRHPQADGLLDGQEQQAGGASHPHGVA